MEDPVRAPSVLALEPGRILGLIGPPGAGLTRIGLSLLAAPARRGSVAYLDARGWFCPQAAWEAGLPPERLVIVRCGDRLQWPRVTAALLEGIGAIYAEVPAGVRETLLRRLGALARARRTAVMLRPLEGDLPRGLSHLEVAVRQVTWEGTDGGHGRLRRRRLVIEASGRGTGGMEGLFEVEDDGTHAVRVVSRLAPAASLVSVGRTIAG